MSDPNCLHCVLWEAFQKWVLSRETLNPIDMTAEACQAAAEIIACVTPTASLDSAPPFILGKFSRELRDAIVEVKANGMIRQSRGTH